jgi:hypothetical protein
MNTDKLGIISIKLQNHPFNTNALNLISEISSNHPYKEACVFTSYTDVPLPTNVPVLHLVHAKFFTGDIIIGDMISAMMCKSFPNIKNLYLYAQNIPWLGKQNSMHKQWAEIFDNPILNIIAQNQSIYDVFDICCKKPIGISENLNYEELSKLI